LVAVASIFIAGMVMMNKQSEAEDLTLSFKQDALKDWFEWKAKFQREYESVQEEIYRIKVFKENQIWIE